ncbi:STAS-like domain-containing protein [Flavobacterium sp.]|uniref:STAS-like domain-containing protein n=1 Tax=Flavobacterium sp. TaxID=239 RepID=UPI00260FF5CE|nr:STAS-like domain-containing protein [Flavobacterium sp.]MDD3003535.1 STAS-like domain-containing protein [Flavobacterium sp.]
MVITMGNIKINEVIGGNFAVTTDDGNLVFNLLDKDLEQKKEIKLDFSEIIVLTTAFLNAAIGQLYSKYKSEDIAPFLKLTNVADEDKILFKKVTERAKEYFANKEDFEKNSNDAINGND